MSVKSELLKLLQSNTDTYLSGEDVAKKLNCSRAAVWKAVKSLENEGYHITGISNKGYMLKEESDIINLDSIYGYLNDEYKDINIKHFKTIDSTNLELKRMASLGFVEEGTVVIAEEQTKGRGRRGRSFYSPSSTGIYLSMLLRPALPIEESIKITTAAAVATSRAIESVADVDALIKWVNDIYVDNRKVCGSLTEATFSLEDNKLDYIVLGIGVNLYSPEGDFPDEIKETAGSVMSEAKWASKNKLIALIVSYFLDYYKELEKGTYVDEYRNRLIWRNEQINIISGQNTEKATLIDVDNNCHLMVRYEDGTEETISSGEISIRKI